jgi:hypothetical protein
VVEVEPDAVVVVQAEVRLAGHCDCFVFVHTFFVTIILVARKC